MRNAKVALFCDAFACWFMGSIAFGLFGLLMPTWSKMFGKGYGTVALVITFMLVALGFSMFFAGTLSDKYGCRKIMSIASIAAGIVIYCFAHASSIIMLYVIAFLFGSCTCFIYLPASSSAQRWFIGRRGIASGFVNLIFGISAAAMLPLYRLWLSTIGYEMTLTIVAILTGVVTLILAQFTEFPRKPPTKEAPRVPTSPVLEGLTLREALRTGQFWMLWVTLALAGGAGMGMVTNSTLIAGAFGFNGATAALCLSFFNITNGLSRIVSGIMSDIVSNRKSVLFGGYLLGMIGFFLIPSLGHNLAALLVFNLFAGFGFGTMFAVSGPLAIDCFGVKHFGVIFGVLFTAYGFVGSWDGPFVGSKLYEIFGNYTATCMLFGAFSLISALSVLFIKKPVVHY